MSFGSTKELLENYQHASKHLEAFSLQVSEEKFNDKLDKEKFHELTKHARELMSRGILSNDPRTFLFLIWQIEILLKIFGHPILAARLNKILQQLVDYYNEHGSF